MAARKPANKDESAEPVATTEAPKVAPRPQRKPLAPILEEGHVIKV